MAVRVASTRSRRGVFDDDGGLQRFSLVSADRSGGCLLLNYRKRDASD